MSDWELAGIEFIIENDFYGMRDGETEQEIVDSLIQNYYSE